MTHGIASGFTDQGEIIPDNLIAGEFPRIARMETITGGVLLQRGAVLGRITDDNRHQISAIASVDGSETPMAILAEDIDVTNDDVEAVVYSTGEFNELALTFGAGHTIETVRQALRDRSIFLRINVPV